MRAARWSTACVALLAALALSPALAAIGGRLVALGDYEAYLLPAGSDYTLGAFQVVKAGKQRRIVAGDRYAGIFYPDANECDDYDLPLAARSIPISAKRRFKIKERTPIEQSFVRVRWKGHWSRSGKASGTITIVHEGCHSRHRWAAAKVR
jgi:hypothetical protein